MDHLELKNVGLHADVLDIRSFKATNYDALTVVQTDVFEHWLTSLRDARAKAKVLTRIDRLANGNAGDVKAVGNGISELRIDYGQGYRVYYKQTRREIVLLLSGGDKSTQTTDIEQAKRLAEEA